MGGGAAELALEDPLHRLPPLVADLRGAPPAELFPDVADVPAVEAPRRRSAAAEEADPGCLEGAVSSSSSVWGTSVRRGTALLPASHFDAAGRQISPVWALPKPMWTTSPSIRIGGPFEGRKGGSTG